MSEDFINETNGVFDINKQAVIVANLVVDLLIGAMLVRKEEGDKAAFRAAEIFLSFRTNPVLSSAATDADLKEESGRLAQMMVAGLMEAGIVTETNRLRAFEIAEEEIFVQRLLED